MVRTNESLDQEKRYQGYCRKQIRGKGKEKLHELALSFVDAFNELIRRFLEQDVKPLIEQLEDVDEIHNIEKKKKLIKLVKEYRNLEMYLGLFNKLMTAKKTTAERIGRLMG